MDGLVLVTGGHGFIGGHVARRLCDLGHRVRITDIIPHSYHDQPSDAEVMLGNLCDPSFCTRVVCDVKIVLHFAANMGGMGVIHSDNDFAIYGENHTMTMNLLSACLAVGVERFFYASSACVYPESLQGKGNVDVSLKEADVWAQLPPRPQGLYGLEKLNTEQVLSQFSSRMAIRIARFHNVFGPGGCWAGGREKAPAALLRKAFAAKMAGTFPLELEIWGDGLQRRSFCFIDDAVDAIVRLLQSRCCEPVNIGSDHAVTIRELAEIAVRCAELDLGQVHFLYDSSKPIGVGSRNSNNSFVLKQLGWSPNTSLETGMQRTGQWISSEMNRIVSGMTDSQRAETLLQLQTSTKMDLHSDGDTFAILLPITSRGSSSPADCLMNLTRFARSLAATTTYDVGRLGQHYRIRVYLAIDYDDDFLLGENGHNKAADTLRTEGFLHVVTLICMHPRGHVCAIWRDCARRAWQDGCDYFTLMGDDVILQDANWMSAVCDTFADFVSEEAVPKGFGCVAFTDTSFPGMPTFPIIHRTHMEIFGGEVIPASFINQDGDPFLFQLYQRWGCSRMISSRICNRLGGSEGARYQKVHAVGWTFNLLDSATTTVEAWLRRSSSSVQRKLTLDVIIPCYRVNLSYLDVFLALQPSRTCTVMFIIIIDDPTSPNISKLMDKYAHRPDVRIRVNKVNLGASASRNRGLQESSAEWVHFLDDDVSPDANVLIEAEKAIRAHPEAAGFVGTAHFPSADTVSTAAIHLAGVTYFWDIATKMRMDTDLPWGVTANLIARRNIQDGVLFDPEFPKTGGGEDIDFCRKKRNFSIKNGGGGFHAAPDVVVTHPWWNNGKRSYWRFYMWSKGDSGLIGRYPEFTYREAAPNSAELLFLCGVVVLAGCVASLVSSKWSFLLSSTGIEMATAVFITNIVHDLYRHLWRDVQRTATIKMTVTGLSLFMATIESTFIRIFSEWGRLVGMIERKEFRLIGMSFDWFTDRLGDAPRNEENMNRKQRMTIFVLVFAILFAVT
ncbi:hypothetical protein AcV7_007840 [Taiwanofungus camphoratus]|nr:hypothetical protein AcW2_006872 [Antrodia cinnamomea]KAI0951868.1 hypothetical protein AcV7_007840 [Antrodia cinnamomea]